MDYRRTSTPVSKREMYKETPTVSANFDGSLELLVLNFFIFLYSNMGCDLERFHQDNCNFVLNGH